MASQAKTTSTVLRTRKRRPNQSIRMSRPSTSLSFGMPSAPMALAGGVAVSSSQKSVADMKNASAKEKKEMQGLNEKLANYLERVRVLEAENKYYKELINKTKVEFNSEVIKVPYQEQIDELKAQLEDKDKELSTVKSRNECLEEEVRDLREQLQHLQSVHDGMQNQIDALHDEVAQRTADSETSRRRAGELEKQLADWKTRYGILDGQMNELRVELQNETTARLTESANVKRLEDELDFLQDVSQAEIKEYQMMLSKQQKMPDFKAEWKSEIGNVVADLSAEYEAQLQSITTAMELRHADQIQQLKAGAKPEITKKVASSNESRRSRYENSELMDKLSAYEDQIQKLRNTVTALTNELEDKDNELMTVKAESQQEIDSLRMELESMLQELQNLTDAKLSLELEIAAYRRLLEGEESRMGLSNVVSNLGGFQTDAESILASALNKSKVTMSRTTNGNVSILELESNGKYIELQDNSNFLKGTTSLKNWTLTQTCENGKTFTHTFNDANTFANGKTVKVWGSKHGSGQAGVVSDTVAEWGPLTSPSTITLKDNNKKDSAVIVIKTNN
ncbi:70 kDa neurofilament protein-like [Argonauta hians]